MTIVGAYRYALGKAPCVVPISGKFRASLEDGAFDWIGLFEPGEEDMADIARQYCLNPLAVEDAMTPNHAPKTESYAEQLFIVVRTAALDGDEAIAYGQTGLFLGKDFLITVRQGSPRAHTDLPCIDEADRPWFRDVLDHVRRNLARVANLQDLLASVVETAALLEQHRQGEMTRQLAARAAILAVPTAIAGIYGMNFRFMPELSWHYGYFIIVGGMAAICLALFLRFRRLGWL